LWTVQKAYRETVNNYVKNQTSSIPGGLVFRVRATYRAEGINLEINKQQLQELVDLLEIGQFRVLIPDTDQLGSLVALFFFD
jgi:hypothetical protein